MKEFVLKHKNIETDEKAKPNESSVSADELECYCVTLVDYFSRAQQPLTELMPAEFFSKRSVAYVPSHGIPPTPDRCLCLCIRSAGGMC